MNQVVFYLLRYQQVGRATLYIAVMYLIIAVYGIYSASFVDLDLIFHYLYVPDGFVCTHERLRVQLALILIIAGATALGLTHLLEMCYTSMLSFSFSLHVIFERVDCRPSDIRVSILHACHDGFEHLVREGDRSLSVTTAAHLTVQSLSSRRAAQALLVSYRPKLTSIFPLT
jgi:hypothetical protein